MGPEGTTGDWAAAMQKAQADLLRQWTDVGSAWAKATGTTPGATPGAGPGAGSATAPAADEVARNFLRSSEQYLGVSRSLWELLSRANSTTDAEQRTRVFSDGLAGLQQQFANLWATTSFGTPATAGANPFAFATAGPGAPMGMPGLGPTRESQESMQRLGQLAMRCAQAQMQVSTQWNEIIAKALQELSERIAPRLKAGTVPTSMKEVYDLWVDSAESVYAQAARGAAYVQAQAELANASSQLRSAQRELIEEWARQFDLPTRAELNSIHQQLRELKAALQR